MKKFLKIAGLVIAFIIVIAAGLSLFINAYFTSGRLTALIVPKIEQATGRKASIGSINISLFKGGVVLSDMALARRTGKGEFLSAKELVLKYRLLPLLKKQLVINRLYIDSPYIFIERAKDGTFNFSDLKERLEAGKKEGRSTGKKSFNVAIQGISIKNAQARFVDEMGTLPSAQANADMDFSLGQPGSPAQAQPARPVISGVVDLKSLKTVFENIHSNISGKIKIASQRIDLALEAAIEQDRIKIKGFAVNYPAAPAISLDVSSQRLDLNRLLALMPHGKKRKEAAKRPAKGGAATHISAKGSINIATALYQRYTISGLNADWRYSSGAFSINPFKAAISGGDKVIVQGNLLGSIGFGKIGRQNTLYGKGQARFSRILVKESPIASQMAVLLGMPELRNPSFTDSLMNYEIKNGNTFLNGYFDSAALEINPVKGTIGVNKVLNIAIALDFSPAFAARIGKKYLRFLTNAKGWTVVPMEITGTTQRPRVGISKAAAGKAIEKGLGGEIKKQLQKIFR